MKTATSVCCSSTKHSIRRRLKFREYKTNTLTENRLKSTWALSHKKNIGEYSSKNMGTYFVQ